MSGLSVKQVLAELDGIERSIGSYERGTPRAFKAFGGREALLRRSEATCVGPIPRLTNEEWATFAAENAELQRERWASRDPRARAGIAVGQEPGADVIPSRHAGPMFSRS